MDDSKSSQEKKKKNDSPPGYDTSVHEMDRLTRHTCGLGIQLNMLFVVLKEALKEVWMWNV